jgi:NAD+ diphosphatase
MVTFPDTLLRAYPPAAPAPGPAVWLPFYRGELLIPVGDGSMATLHRGTPSSVEALSLNGPLYLGTLGETPCLAAEADPDGDLPEGWAAVSLRDLFGKVSDAEYSLAGYAAQILYWRRTSVFCPVCGHRTEARNGDWGRHCPECGHVGYPHLSPATLILVHDGPRLLLAQKPGWGSRWSILAGFVEPGESLEECVRREVKEEVGVDVGALAYAGSQPWPFPHQLMVGFTAQYTSGDIRPDGEELERAAWFTRETLPDLPSPVSLSRQMIDTWIAQK